MSKTGRGGVRPGHEAWKWKEGRVSEDYVWDVSLFPQHFLTCHMYASTLTPLTSHVRAHIRSSASLCNSLKRGCLSMPVDACT